MRDRLRGAAISWQLPALAVALLLTSMMVSATIVVGEGEGGETPSQASASENDQKVNVKRLEEKLDEILTVQESTLSRFDQIMEDLRIVKIRVSR